MEPGPEQMVEALMEVTAVLREQGATDRSPIAIELSMMEYLLRYVRSLQGSPSSERVN